MVDLHIAVGDRTLSGAWLDEHADTRDAIAAALPVAGEASRWGDELYMSVDVRVTPDGGRADVPVGTLAYWPDGPAICLFWGPTPASTDGTPRAASPVAPVARVDDVSPLRSLDGAATMRIERA